MDHRGEQVNKVLKIEGGVLGISRNENARTKFMLNAPILADIADNFKNSYKQNSSKTNKHHQLGKSYTKRQNEMKKKIVEILHECDVNFMQKNDVNLRNFVTNKIYVGKRRYSQSRVYWSENL